MSWKREGDRVTVEMSVDDWERLVFTVGFAWGYALRENDLNRAQWITRFFDAINEGNPNYTPY